MRQDHGIQRVSRPEAPHAGQAGCLIYGRLIVILVVQRLLALASTKQRMSSRSFPFARLPNSWCAEGGFWKPYLISNSAACLGALGVPLEKIIHTEAKTPRHMTHNCAASGLFGQLGRFGPLCPRGFGPGRLHLAWFIGMNRLLIAISMGQTRLAFLGVWLWLQWLQLRFQVKESVSFNLMIIMTLTEKDEKVQLPVVRFQGNWVVACVGLYFQLYCYRIALSPAPMEPQSNPSRTER